jgi:hypothetical protein
LTVRGRSPVFEFFHHGLASDGKLFRFSLLALAKTSEPHYIIFGTVHFFHFPELPELRDPARRSRRRIMGQGGSAETDCIVHVHRRGRNGISILFI